MPLTLAPGKLKEDHRKFEARLGYTVRFFLKVRKEKSIRVP